MSLDEKREREAASRSINTMIVGTTWRCDPVNRPVGDHLNCPKLFELMAFQWAA
jgi:hypothetical protein